MRRKKLANKIVSILMASMMAASTPISVMAEEMTLSDEASVVWQGETDLTDDALYQEETGTEESVEEADEEIVVEQESDLGNYGGGYSIATRKKAR